VEEGRGTYLGRVKELLLILEDLLLAKLETSVVERHCERG
jgi:hypothetical protein